MLGVGEHRIEINGVVHWVRMAGQDDGRPPIVVVHGGPGGNSYLCELTCGPGLTRFATVVYYDQRGCGRSEEPAVPDAYTLEYLVADIEGLRAELGVDRLVLHAPPITNPLRPNGWWLRPAMVDTVLGPEKRAALRAELAGQSGQAERFAAAHRALDRDPVAKARFLCHDPAKAPELLRILDAAEELGTNEKMGPALRLLGADDLSDALADADVPTLIMVGLSDRHVGVDACRDLADRLPRGELRLFLRSAHFPEHEQPEDYVEAVRDFLGR